VSVDARGARGYVGGNREIGNPQIFNKSFAECVFDCLVESITSEHGGGRISQIEQLIEPSCHFLHLKNRNQFL
jgi:hypothetical protein